MSGDIQARFAQALKLQQAGQSDAALALYAGIVMERPQTAEAHFQIGKIHAAAGHLGKSKAALMKAFEHRPGEQAIVAALRQVTPAADRAALDRDMAAAIPQSARLAFAEMQRRDGRYAAAEAGLRALLKSRHEAARHPLAKLLAETCRVEEAEVLLSRAKQKTGRTWYDIALLRVRLRKVPSAREAMTKAIKGGADPASAAVGLSGALSREGEATEAEAVLNSAVKAQPGRGALFGQRGQIRQSLGQLKAAQSDLRKAIASDPNDGEAYRAYFAGAKAKADDPLLAQCEARLQDVQLPVDARTRMHFGMSKAFFDLGRDADAFDHLHKANALQKKAFPFDFQAALAGARANLACARKLAGETPVGPEGKVLFVAGLPRSGTTLVETVLAAHSSVSAGGELPFLVDALKPLSDQVADGAEVTAHAFKVPGQRYLECAHRRLGTAPVFTDKSVATPYRIGLAVYALPESRFILPRRDPRDVGLSIYRNMFAGGTQRFSSDLFEIGRMIRLHDAMIDAWREMFPERIHVVDYEALTADPDPHIRALIDAAGLPWEEACLAPHLSDRRVDTLSFAQVRQPIYRSSVAGWRRHEAELGPLEEGLAQAVDLG